MLQSQVLTHVHTSTRPNLNSAAPRPWSWFFHEPGVDASESESTAGNKTAGRDRPAA